MEILFKRASAFTDMVVCIAPRALGLFLSDGLWHDDSFLESGKVESMQFQILSNTWSVRRFTN